jgi:hypothetical protein
MVEQLPFVKKQPNIDVAIVTVIASNATSE